MPASDETDKRLIALLREDGRAPVAKLAAILNVSRATVQARLDRLLKTGAVLGFTIRAKEDRGDTVIRAVMMIELAGRTTTAIIRYLRGITELHSLHTTNGTWDLVAEIRADSLSDFDRVLREVRAIEGVLNSKTSILLTSIL
jgi:DNA-binding Lrp family transcriptional regulator